MVTTTRRLIFVTALTFLTGCAAIETPATEAEIAQARDAHLRCAVVAIAALDDGVSSADVVAQAAANRCRVERANQTAVASRGRSPHFARAYEDASEKQYTEFVLTHRRLRKEQRAPQRR